MKFRKVRRLTFNRRAMDALLWPRDNNRIICFSQPISFLFADSVPAGRPRVLPAALARARPSRVRNHGGYYCNPYICHSFPLYFGLNNYFAQSPKLKTSTFGKPACSGKSRKY